MYRIFLFLLLPFQLFAQPFSQEEITRWKKQAADVSIIRDNWGIPHIYGKKDADAVFGLMYAQCEDDFKRIELNYLDKLGRTAELKGESALSWDLLNRIFFDSTETVNDYNKAPLWLKQLCNAFADGVNYYLYKNPGKASLLTRFKPWYPLLWTDGSIDAINMADITQAELANLYLSGNPISQVRRDEEEVVTGSNGFAFSPTITSSGNAMLYINPHVTFYFRPEVHINSEEGLNAYGAVTWGQFFVYQGFNEHCGWMHTSSKVDAGDSYIEKISAGGNGWVYEYNNTRRPVIQKRIVLSYKAASGIAKKEVTVLYTHHGPIMAKRNGEYLSVKADNRIMNGLVQCWMRNKTKSFTDYKKTLDLKGNISNNTVYADAEGNIAYWHGNRVPKRDTRFNWNQAVDGTITATEWQGYHSIEETVHSINPPNGWLQNCNSTPFTVAGTNSPKKENYPAYMAPDGENFRGINAVRVLSEGKNYDLDKIIAAGYDKRIAAFEVLVPALINEFEKIRAGNDPSYNDLADAIAELKKWDFRCGENSIATTLAIEWGQSITGGILQTKIADKPDADFVDKTRYFAAHEKLVAGFHQVIRALTERYGKWRIPWGEINRFQRISADVDNKFDDNKPSIPVGFVSSTWGMLPSYSSRTFAGTQKRYGVNGNSFICAVEFGKRVKAKSLLAGGESGDEQSKHFFDQGEMYSKGIFKEVYFYKEDVLKHIERNYHPGE